MLTCELPLFRGGLVRASHPHIFATLLFVLGQNSVNRAVLEHLLNRSVDHCLEFWLTQLERKAISEDANGLVGSKFFQGSRVFLKVEAHGRWFGESEIRFIGGDVQQHIGPGCKLRNRHSAGLCVVRLGDHVLDGAIKRRYPNTL